MVNKSYCLLNLKTTLKFMFKCKSVLCYSILMIRGWLCSDDATTEHITVASTTTAQIITGRNSGGPSSQSTPGHLVIIGMSVCLGSLCSYPRERNHHPEITFL